MATNFNTVVSSSASNAQITSQGNTALITKAYADANYSGGGGGGGTAYFLQATGNTGTQEITDTGVVVEIDTADYISNSSHFTLASTGQITIANAGTYFIGFTVDADQTGGTNRQMTICRLETNGGSGSTFTEIEGSRASAYSRNSTDESESIHRGGSIITVSAGETIRVFANKSTADETITAQLAKCSIQIMSIAASVGASGVSSATSTSTTANVDLSNVAGTYYTAVRSSGTITVASGAVAGGFAHLRVLYSGGEPTVSGATKMASPTYDTSNEMKMVFYNDGSGSYYYFLEI